MSAKDYKPDIADQQRIVIALGIVATDVAILALSGSREVTSSIVGVFFFVPAVFSFLFILLIGSHLKFKRPGDIGELAIPHGLRQWSYDTALNAYWWALILAVITFVAYLFGWDGESSTFLSYWPTYFVSASILLVFVLVMFGSSRRDLKPKRRATRKIRGALKKD